MREGEFICEDRSFLAKSATSEAMDKVVARFRGNRANPRHDDLGRVDPARGLQLKGHVSTDTPVRHQ